MTFGLCKKTFAVLTVVIFACALFCVRSVSARQSDEFSYYLWHTKNHNDVLNRFPGHGRYKQIFERVASFPVFLNTRIDTRTVAEIVAVSDNGRVLIYTDSAGRNIGFVDITNPYNPEPKGILEIGGKPTSVAVAGSYALVSVNTSPGYMIPDGDLVVIDIDSRTIVARHNLGGQPDSVAISPDKRYAAVVIENERDGNLDGGVPPQLPAGYLVIVDIKGDPVNWSLRNVDLRGVADIFPQDPEPEYVDINRQNIAAVTLQENNHIVLVNLENGQVINDFSAGRVNLKQVDIHENGLIEMNGSLNAVPREPDGVSWISDDLFATADEGDLYGGSRGFTVFSARGDVVYTSGNSNEHIAARIGHYPETRSEHRGNEPESVEYGVYGNDSYLFVGSERSGVVFVYQLFDSRPRLVQVLPAGAAPEGLLAIPRRDLFVVASEEDSRDDKLRSVLTIYARHSVGVPSYPTIVSDDRPDGTPIPWAALSGLAADRNFFFAAYAVADSFYRHRRIYAMNIANYPARITHEIVLDDAMGRLAAVAPGLVNADGSVNLDLEGVATRYDGGFWLVSEGAGTAGNASRPFISPNLLLKVSHYGLIERVVTLPDTTHARQVRFGLEGVAVTDSWFNETVYVAFQREWPDDPENRVRIGVYNVNDNSWKYLYYPLEAPSSINGGWVGLSEITALSDTEFAVIERDNQAGPDAAVKRVYRFSTANLVPLPDSTPGTTPDFPVVNKQLVRDLIPDQKVTGGLALEKPAGMTLLNNGTVLIVNDNDGVDASSGETQLLRIPGMFR